MSYRNANSAVAYLNRMERPRTYYPDETIRTIENENTREPYITPNPQYEPILITASQLLLPVPGAEITASPTLADDPVPYYK